MKRFLALTVAVATGVAALTFIGGSPSLAAAPQLSPTIIPPADQTAVKDGDWITFGGTVAPGASLVNATLRFLDRAGEPVRDDLDISSEMQFVDGQIQGTTRLSSFDDLANDGTVLVLVTAEQGGDRTTATSNPLTVDLRIPLIQREAMVAPDRVQVTFTEAVHVPQAIGDSIVDWLFCPDPSCNPNNDGLPFMSVEGSGASRNLVVAPPLKMDEDGTPNVQYKPLFPRTPYRDRAGHILDSSRTKIAIDKIAPALPSLEQVAGKTNTQLKATIHSNDSTPSARLTGLRAGHVGQLWLESGDVAGSGFGPTTDVLLGEATADADGVALIEVSDDHAIGDDGSYKLYGVARDHAKCRPEDAESLECPNMSDGDAAFYAVDTVSPTTLFAVSDLDEGGQPIVKVRFTENIVPVNDAGEWSIATGTVQSVEGIGDLRTLDTNMLLPGGTLLSWRPTEASAYTDAAGNPVAEFQLAVIDAVRPVITSVSPGLGETKYTSANWEISGTTENNAVSVVLYPDGQAGQPGAAIKQVPVQNGNFSITVTVGVELLANATNRFDVQAMKLTDDAQPQEIFGNVVDVGAIVHDNQLPVVTDLTVTSADGDAIHHENEQLTIEWTATDPNLIVGPVVLEYSMDGAASWTAIRSGLQASGTDTFTTPDESSAQAMIRARAIDKVDLEGAKANGPFTIDAEDPTFFARTLDATHAEVVFSEPVVIEDDEMDELQWRIENILVSTVETPPGDTHTAIERLILTTGPVPVSGVQQQLGSNSEPCVTFVTLDTPPDQQIDCDPATPNQSLLNRGFKDPAANPMAITDVLAADGIDPLAPSVAGLPSLTTATQLTITGSSAEKDPTNKAVAKRSDGKMFSGAIGPNGSFSIPVELIRDADSSFQVLIKDPASNLSGSQAVHSENDGTSPQVKVNKLQQRRSGARRIIRIRWSSVDKHRATADILFRVGNRRLLRIAKATPDDGSYVWRVPRHLTGKRLRVLVQATDLVGNRSQAYSPRLRVR